ncbi:MAG: C39 family peptidase [Eubacterium sp.]|nr:C39 family peptidase [Eubacterium sp.]
MNYITNPSTPLINKGNSRLAVLSYRMVLACFCMILALSVNPLRTDARGNDKENSGSVVTDHQYSPKQEATDIDPKYTEGESESVLPAEYTDEEPEDPDPEPEYTQEESENPAGPVFPVYPVNPAGGNSGGNNLVTYTANTISKGGYSTTIWKQHSIWKKRSSASRHGCGICVTSMALQLSGVLSSPNRVLKQTNRSERSCQSLKPKQAVKILKKNHVAVKPVNTKAYSRKQCMIIMKNALDKGKMVMALVRGKPFSNNTHWVLIVGYDTKGRIVVANSSYGNRNRCKKTKKQYHLVNWKQIQKKIIRDSINYSAFIIVG